MPRLSEAMKDVISCEKLRGAANKRRSEDVRMGKPISNDMMIIIRPTRGTETSKYPEEKKITMIP